MFIERRLNPTTNQVELWNCQWEYVAGAPARKVLLNKVADEQPLKPEGNSWSQAQAICWAYGRTLGNIAVFAPAVLGDFPAKLGDDACCPATSLTRGSSGMAPTAGGVEPIDLLGHEGRPGVLPEIRLDALCEPRAADELRR